MSRRRLLITAVTSVSSLTLAGAGLAGPTWAAAGHGGGGQGEACSAGAHTLSRPGAHVYPDTGNGGYASVHTDVHLVYDARQQVPARQPRRAHRPGHAVPDQLQPGLRAEVRQYGGRTRHDRQVGHRQRPRGRLHVRPADLPRRPERAGRPQPAGARGLAEQPGRRPGEQPAAPGLLARTAGHRRRRELAERDPVPGQQAGDHAEDPDQGRLGVHREGQLHGRPGVHNDGDGTTEGWFRASDGAFVTTEPVGSEDWMPLNDYPTAKATYDFYDTVSAGKTGVANGVLESVTRHAPDKHFPAARRRGTGTRARRSPATWSRTASATTR